MRQRHLVLLGAGHAHVHLLKTWAQKPLPNTRITLVSPYARTFYSGMVPAWIAGHYTLAQCEIAVPPLALAAGVKWLPLYAVALNANQQSVLLEDGQTLDYDFISLDTGSGSDSANLDARIPGAQKHGVKVRPLEDLARQWPALLAQAAQAHDPLTVIGGGAASFELACALRHRFSDKTVQIVSGAFPPGRGYASGVQEKMRLTLANLHISVTQASCTALSEHTVTLSNGQTLPSAQTWVATGSIAPSWLSSTGLDLCAHGFVAVNIFQQSPSHPTVFAVGDVSTRTDHPHPRSGVYAVRAGPALAVNLAAALLGQALRPHRLPSHTLNLLSCGGRSAIAAYGSWSAQGPWVWHWKDYIDRRFMQQYASA